MKILKIFLIALLFAFSSKVFSAYENELETRYTNRAVDFRLYYPIVKIRDPAFRISQKNYLGFSMSYHYYPTRMLGYFMEPWIYAIPIARGEGKVRFANAGISGGVAFRLIPGNWFDPSLFAEGGFGWQRAGTLVGSNFFAPIGARATVNLYSNRSPFQDNTLSLVLSGSYNYYFNQSYVLKKSVSDIGLAIRGSF